MACCLVTINTSTTSIMPAVRCCPACQSSIRQRPEQGGSAAMHGPSHHSRLTRWWHAMERGGVRTHKESITAAYAVGIGEVELLGKIGTSKTDIDRLCQRMQSKATHVRIVYEAGPCGYGLYRQLVQKGFDCMVCAPSLIPRKPGERVKTDRRDALKLVRSLRAGDLSSVYVPGVDDEAFRDLARAWAAANADLKHARQRVKSFLLSHGVRYTGSANWGPAHRRWISTFAFPNHWQQLAFDECRRT
ncbi:hypothetical protein BH160DRAFT_1737, partial [Burkholderia sp. H160]